jgi:hypothetical protein
LLGLNQGEIPRFARNDKIKYFFRNLFSLSAIDFCQRERNRNQTG